MPFILPRPRPPKTYGTVRSISQLTRVLAGIQKRYPKSLLLFRGQDDIYPSIRSGRARPGAIDLPEVRRGFCSLASSMLGLPARSERANLVEAILQHYGMSTFYVDLTSDIEVAAWFATHSFESQKIIYSGTALRNFEESCLKKRKTGRGYVVVLAINEKRRLMRSKQLVSLRNLPSNFLRPKRQSGWLVLHRPPIVPSPDDLCVATIAIDCKSFTSHFAQDDLFPPPSEDPAYSTLLDLPFIQVPVPYLQGPRRKRKSKIDTRRGCLARRAIPITEYAVSAPKLRRNHTWADWTLYEPFPMRLWKGWHFDLSQIHEGIHGDVADSSKVTISPRAEEVLSKCQGAPLDWPSIGAHSILFTWGAWDHDKVVEHRSDYAGVWLSRHDELIVEQSMHSNEEKLSVRGGHVYTFSQGKLTRQNTPSSCRCKHPKSHDDRVIKLLRMSAAIQANAAILLPHPLNIPKWFVLL